MFDRIIELTAGRFGLSTEKTKQLLGALVALIFNENRGGPAGFLQAFRNQGLGDVVSSWLGGGNKLPISAAQLDGVLGTGTLGALAGKLGLPADTVGNAATTILPEAVGALGENGQLPTRLPDHLHGWLGDIGGFLGNVGGWGAAAAGAGAAAIGAGVGKAGNLAGDGVRAVGAGLNQAGSAIGSSVGATKSGAGKWWPWLLLGALAVAALLFLRGCKSDESTDSAQGAVAGTASVAAAAVGNAASAASGAAASVVGATASAAGNAAAAAGSAAAAAGGAVERSADAANAALDKLAGNGGKISVDDLIKALNLMPINFDTGSAHITADSAGILEKAAAAIKQAPAGTKIEVGGHTDNTGKADANQRLSQARAAAVVKRLGELGVASGVLSSKGYGQDKPIADNGSAEGRAKNRRIEFTVSP